MNTKPNYKLCIIAPHLVQYHAPLYKEIAKVENLDTTIVYLDTMGLEEFKDTEFNHHIKWDKSLLDGYRHKFLKNYSRKPFSGFFSRINPGIFRELRRNKYDAVLIPGYAILSYWFAFIAAKLTGTKIIWRGEVTLKSDENHSSLIKSAKKFVLPKLLSLCDVILYSCTANKDYLTFYGSSSNKMIFCPCSVDNEFFQRKRADIVNNNNGDIKKELGINNEDLVVLFCARFTQRKRPMDLLRAVNKIDNSKIAVIFVGDGHEKQAMESYARENRIKAKFVGFKGQNDLPRYYSAADVLAVVSDYDPSPKVINEVMNFERPVILTDVVGTAHDLVEEGKNGFVVKPGDVDAVAEKIVFLNNNRDAVKTMGKRSLQIVNTWSLARSADSIKKAVEIASNNRGI